MIDYKEAKKKYSVPFNTRLDEAVHLWGPYYVKDLVYVGIDFVVFGMVFESFVLFMISVILKMLIFPVFREKYVKGYFLHKTYSFLGIPFRNIISTKKKKKYKH